MRGPGGLCDIPNDGGKEDYVTFVIDCLNPMQQFYKYL